MNRHIARLLLLWLFVSQASAWAMVDRVTAAKYHYGCAVEAIVDAGASAPLSARDLSIRSLSGVEGNMGQGASFSFTGYTEDKETSLLYAKARYYDSDTGRFLSQDAWEGETDTPPSLHKYLYAYQNPTVWVDPDGNIVMLPVLAYLAYTSVQTAVDVGVDTGIAKLSGDDEFSYAKSVATNFVINAVTGGVGGKIKNTGKLAKFAAETAIDASVTTAYEAGVEGKDAGSTFVENAVSGVVGRAIGDKAAKHLTQPKITVESHSNPSANKIDESLAAKGAHDEKVVIQGGNNPEKPLWRGDSRSPDVIFEEGLMPKFPGSNTSLEDYVNYNKGSNFVGTSKEISVADDFVKDSGREGFRYKIDDPGHGIDVNEVFPDNIFSHEKEVAFPDGIDTCRIVGCTPIGKDGFPTGSFINNPKYKAE